MELIILLLIIAQSELLTHDLTAVMTVFLTQLNS